MAEKKGYNFDEIDRTEKELQTWLFEHIQGLGCIGGKHVDMEVPIPYKHIYLPIVPKGILPTLEVWCFKQDIAIYDILYDKAISYKSAKVVDNGKDIECVPK